MRLVCLVAGLLTCPIILTAQRPAVQPGRPITVYATVADRSGAFITSLAAGDFLLKEDGRDVAIDAARLETGPATLVMLLDRSGSVAPQLGLVLRLAGAVIDGLGPGDRMQIADLDGQSPPRPASWTSDRAALTQAVEPSHPRNTQTLLWDRVIAAVSALSGEPGYRAIIVISDGQDSMSRSRRDEVTKAAQRARVIVHAIELPLTIRPLVLNGRVLPLTRSNDLRHVISDTGGARQLLPQVPEQAAVNAIRQSIRSSYAISFTPRLNDGKSRELELRTVNRDLTVRIAKRY
jgi:Ca-activated chloride channel family protein